MKIHLKIYQHVLERKNTFKAYCRIKKYQKCFAPFFQPNIMSTPAKCWVLTQKLKLKKMNFKQKFSLKNWGSSRATYNVDKFAFKLKSSNSNSKLLIQAQTQNFGLKLGRRYWVGVQTQFLSIKSLSLSLNSGTWQGHLDKNIGVVRSN